MNQRRNRRRPQDEVRTLIREVRELAGGLDRATFNRRPAEDRWSVAECIEHLNASARLYLPVLTEAIEDARGRGWIGRRGEGRTIVGRIVTWSTEPPVRKRLRTWPELEPERDLELAEVLDAFEALHEELIVRMNEAADLDVGRIRIRSVLDARLRLSLGDWFCFLAAHGRRHLWQARQALKDHA